ncbi:MAG TPA: VanZ family protein [Steroidobacteraceae bacterium]
MIAHDRHVAAWLLAVIVFLIAFGSLYPFSFSLAGAGALERLGELPRAGTTRSDVAANVLLYLPLGTCLTWLLGARLGAAAAVAAATLIAAVLSFSIEFAQLYETRRVASLADFTCNTIGAFAGGWLALAIARTRRHLHSSPFAGLLRHPVAAALVFSWIGYRLSPFAFVLDPAEWAASLAPLGGGLHPLAALQHLVAWLVILALGERLAPGRAMSIAAGAMGLVLAGRIVFGGLSLETAEIGGMAAALLLARPLARLPRENRAWLLAAALLLLIAYQGLAPFDFQVAQDRFAFLPFGESLTQYRAGNLADMFLRCFTNGALVWLLAQTGLSVLAATSLGAGCVFAIEVLQTWLPGQTAEITDPLLAVCAGGLAAVFEREDAG